MELTGKARDDFEKWLISFFREKRTDYNNLFTDESIIRKFYRKTDVEKNALIIDFFDSVGIYIHQKRSCLCAEFKHWYFVITDEMGCHLNNFMEVKIKNDSRQEAKTEAIKKANLIYNEKY